MIEGMEIHILPSGRVVAFDEDKHRYYAVLDDNIVPLESVTQTLGVCPAPGLPWWGMKVGVAGALKLLDWGEIELGVDGQGVLTTPDDAVDLLTFHKLTVNHVRDEAGARGDEVHDIAEALASGVIPDLDAVDPERRGYAEALVAAWLDLSPEPIAAEVVVCSHQLGVAGKFDLRARIVEGRTAVTDAETGFREPVPAGEWILDYKTSKGVYDKHLLQLEAYEVLSRSSGYEPTDHRGVIRLAPDGSYELVESWATAEQYFDTLDFYRSLEALKSSTPRRPRECKRGGHFFVPAGRERICEECR